MSWRNISEKLKHIPHLKLDFKVPLKEILNEMNSAALDFERIHLNLALRNEPTKIRPWFGRGLIDYLPDSRKLYEYRALETEWIKRDEWEDVIVSPTELAPLMPVTMKFVHSIIGKPRITRLLKLPAGAVETASQDLIYEAAEVRILNAWDEHQVENRGDQDRITLYIEAPLTDELFLGHVKRALEL